MVLLTGASSGIGKELSIQLAQQGAKLGLLARRHDILDSLVEQAEAKGSKAMALPADVRDAAAVRDAADRVRAGHRRVVAPGPGRCSPCWPGDS